MSHLALVDGSSEKSGAAGGSLGPEQQPVGRSAAVEPEATSLSSDLARVGAIPASNSVVDAALRLVTALASETVEGADGVSVSLERHGRLQTVAATDDTILVMDHHQYETGEGPCVDAATEGRWFHAEDMAEETRWPSFVPLARGQGISSILSTPLLTAERPLGALNIYSRADHAFGPRQQELAALFAEQASGILTDAGADVSDDQLAGRIASALRSRQVIAHAQGVLMERDGIEPDAAATILIRAARAANRTLLDQATEVVASARREPRAGR